MLGLSTIGDRLKTERLGRPAQRWHEVNCRSIVKKNVVLSFLVTYQVTKGVDVISLNYACCHLHVAIPCQGTEIDPTIPHPFLLAQRHHTTHVFSIPLPPASGGSDPSFHLDTHVRPLQLSSARANKKLFFALSRLAWPPLLLLCPFLPLLLPMLKDDQQHSHIIRAPQPQSQISQLCRHVRHAQAAC